MNSLRRFVTGTAVALTSILGTWTHAANVPTLVRDINQTPIGVGSQPTFLGTLGGWTYLAADDGVHGNELWKTDGTGPGTSLVKDINPGSAASNPANFLVVGNLAYFSATTAASGQEIWVTDGTSAGTRLVAELAAGTQSSGSFPAGALGSKVLIFGYDAGSIPHLYVSDGTASGTVALANTYLYPQPTPGILTTATNGKAYFTAFDTSGTARPWVTDGSAAGTHALGMTSSGTAISDGDAFTQAGAYVYFSATAAGAGQLFRARLADDVIEQVTTNTAPQNFGLAGDKSPIVAAGNLVYFIGYTAGVTQMWRSDGTAAGTFPVAPFSGMAGNSPVSPRLTIANNHLFFVSASGPPGFSAAFASDGTVAGTINLTEQFNAPASIMGSDGNYAYLGPGQLMRSDGTAGGTHVMNNLGGLQILSATRSAFAADTHAVYFGVIGDWPGDNTRSSYATFKYDPVADSSVVLDRAADQPGSLFAVSGGRLYFSVVDQTTGDEPWVSDGTVAGTLLLADISPEPSQAGSNPNSLYAFQGKLYFSATDGIAGTELWKSDGSANGTVLAADLQPGPADSQPVMLFGAGNALMLFGYNSQTATKYLWRYDPATGATFNFPSVSTPYTCQTVTPATTATGITYFEAFGAGVDLWRTDGSVANTLEIPPGSGGYSFLQSCNLVALGSAVYFLGQDAAGYGLWGSDGTLAGTTKLASLGVPQIAAAPSFLTLYAGQLYFLAADTNNQLALYRSDGTSSHTSIVAAAPALLDGQIGIVNGRMLFGTSNYVGNVGLWAFDATTMAFSSIPGVRYVSPGTVAENGALAFFTGSATPHVAGPWVTDGTTAGTKSLADAGGNYQGAVQWLGDFHSTAIYTDTDPNSGVGRYWKSNGTIAGTTLIATMSSGQHVSSAGPAGVAVADKFYFAVFDPTIGSELWALKQDAISTATTLTVSPTPAAAGAPVLLSATVRQIAGSATPTGSVSFMDGGSTLGSAALDQTGTATLTTSTLSVGQHALAAVYSGDSVNSSSTSAAVNLGIVAAPSVSLSISATAITLGQSATLTWSSANATQCTASNGWSGSQSISGSTTVTPSTAGTVSYVLTCANTAASANATVTLTVNAAAAASSSGHGGGGQLLLPELMILGLLVIRRRFAALRFNFAQGNARP